MEGFNPNWLAILVAAASTLVVGFLWYGPLFGKAWMRESGMTEEKVKSGNMPLIFGFSFIFGIVLALSMYIETMIGGAPGEAHGQDPFITFKHGAFHGIIMGLFVLLPVLGTIALYERKSIKYVAIAVGYWTVSLAVVGGIVNVWQ